MKSRYVIRNMAMLGFVLLWQNYSSAVGLGLYSRYGVGSQKAEGESVDTSRTAVGFLLDTAVANSSVFNYRLSIGYEKRTDDGFDFHGPYSRRSADLDYNLLVLDNIFGFGVVRTPHVRFWIGPELRLFGGTMKDDSLSISTTTTMKTSDGKMYGAAIGPALGVNFHLGHTISLYLATSVLYSYAKSEFTYGETGRRQVSGSSYYTPYGYRTSYYYQDYQYKVDLDTDVTGFAFDAHIGLIFRFGNDSK